MFKGSSHTVSLTEIKLPASDIYIHNRLTATQDTYVGCIFIHKYTNFLTIRTCSTLADRISSGFHWFWMTVSDKNLLKIKTELIFKTLQSDLSEIQVQFHMCVVLLAVGYDWHTYLPCRPLLQRILHVLSKLMKTTVHLLWTVYR